MNILIHALGEKGFSVVATIAKRIESKNIYCVVGQDANVSDDFSEKIINFCIAKGIQYSLRKQVDYCVDDYDFFLAVGWRWMINAIPAKKLIIFHDSLLPKYRGFSPLVNALINKEPAIGVTVLLGGEDYDKGNILLQKSITVSYPTTIGEQVRRISAVYAALAVELLDGLFNKTLSLKGCPQNENLATYGLWRDADDYRISWSDSATSIEHFVNCVNSPFQGASSLLEGQLIRILEVQAVPDVKIENRTPGKVIFVKENFPVVVCGEGLLILKDLRDKSGKSILPLAKFRSKFQ